MRRTARALAAAAESVTNRKSSMSRINSDGAGGTPSFCCRPFLVACAFVPTLAAPTELLVPATKPSRQLMTVHLPSSPSRQAFPSLPCLQSRRRHSLSAATDARCPSHKQDPISHETAQVVGDDERVPAASASSVNPNSDKLTLGSAWGRSGSRWRPSRLARYMLHSMEDRMEPCATPRLCVSRRTQRTVTVERNRRSSECTPGLCAT